MQFAIGEGLLPVDLGRDPDERLLVGASGEVPVDRVVAEIRLAADIPAGERRPGIVEDAVERPLPVNEPGLLAPESFAILDRAAMELPVA